MAANPTTQLVWVFSEKVVRLFLGTALTLLLARQLGPAEFGKFSTIFAGFMLLTAVAGLGLKDIVIDETASGRMESRDVLATASGIMFASGSFFGLVLVGVSALLYGHHDSQFWIAVFLSTVLLMKGFDALLYGLEAQAKLRVSALAQQVSVLASAVAKGVLLAIGATVVSFAAVITLEFAVLYLALIYFAMRQGLVLSPDAFRKDYVIALLSRSWPLMASSIAVIGYFYIDQIVIAILMGPEAVGIYATATRISQQLYVLPAILVAAYYPRLTLVNSVSTASFDEGFKALTVVLMAASIVAFALVLLFGDKLIELLLGDDFTATGGILKLHAAGLMLVSINVVSGRWYVMHNLQKLSMIRQLATAVLNVLLNFMLIPSYGLTGAVMATLFSLLFLAFGFDALNRRTRRLLAVKAMVLAMMLRPSSLRQSVRTLVNI